MPGKRTFFISRAGADRRWAELIASAVEEAGHESVHQGQDFGFGESFPHHMMLAAESDCTIVVLSPAYFASEHCMAELHAALASDPLGVHGRILPVLVAPCTLPRLLGHLSYIDLVGVDEVDGRQRLLDALRKERREDAAKPLANRTQRGASLTKWRRTIVPAAAALAGVLGLTAVLLLNPGRAPSRRPGLDSPSPSAGASSTAARPAPPVTEPLRIESMQIESYRGNTTQLQGTIGVLAHSARFEDNVRVRARLSAPGYCYLIALNPDGSIQFCPKDQENATPRPTAEIAYPGEPDGYYGLTDGTGLQAFVLIASAKPLPPFGTWAGRSGLSWASATATEAWHFDGRRIAELGDSSRGTERRVTTAPSPFAALCRYLGRLPDVDAVQATAFPVLPVQVPEPAPTAAP
jgi:hypothetical protein